MGVPRGCAPGLKAPVGYSVSCQHGVSSIGRPFFFFSTNLWSSANCHNNVLGDEDEDLGNIPGSGFHYFAIL
jgi:hypothetical protein